MASHIYHPDLGDPARPGILVDGCPRCEEHAKNLNSLDETFIRALWEKMVAIEHRDETIYGSDAERVAIGQLWAFALILARYTTVDPWTLFERVTA